LRGLIGVARINPQGKVLYGLASGYVAIIRGTPLLVQLFIWYYGLPRLGVMLPFFLRRDWTGPLPAAYVSEIVRGAIMSVERGQNEAARSLGMSSKQAMIKIILPQAIVRMLPPLGNEFIALIKNSALVSLITIHDVMQQGNTIISNTYRDLETYLVIAVIYFVLTSLTVTALRHYEKRHHQKGVQ
jgi:polar amino acid transport system permease protein